MRMIVRADGMPRDETMQHCPDELVLRPVLVALLTSSNLSFLGTALVVRGNGDASSFADGAKPVLSNTTVGTAKVYRILGIDDHSGSRTAFQIFPGAPG